MDNQRLFLSNDALSKHTTEKALVGEVATQPAAMKQYRTNASQKLTSSLKPKHETNAGTRPK